jgi:hypothetical protein
MSAAPSRHTQILVLGAGLQGVCVALAAAARGHRVVLLDQAFGCMQRASLRNEGKIHLGHVYANDETFRTASLMLKSAYSFGPLLDRWLPRPLNWARLRSNPFWYLVAAESLLDVEQLRAHFGQLESASREILASDRSLHYLGLRPERMARRCEPPASVDRGFTQAAFLTPEVSVDLPVLRAALARALEAHPRIELDFLKRIDSISALSSGYRLEGRGPYRERWTRDAEVVVNCLWDGRLALDDQLGLSQKHPWVYRLKHRVIGKLPPGFRVPSMTIVLGPFGDVVTRRNDRSVYLSWYPTCMRGWSSELIPPAEWGVACRGELDVAAQAEIAQATIDGFNRVIPGITRITSVWADGGIIFARGTSDIDDRGSELHRRDGIGITSRDGYHSIDTGKLTSAPLFAQLLVERI